MTETRGDDSSATITRRQLLAGGAGAGGGILLGAALGYALADKNDVDTAAPASTTTTAEPAEGAYPGGKSRDDFVEHKDSPLILETKRSRFAASFITPTPLVFVRQNLSLTPVGADRPVDEWTLQVEGVAGPRAVTLRELKSLGVVTVAAVLQCSGNGRGYFTHDPSGSPWQVGAVANVFWTGVPVKAVVDALGGPAPGVRFVTGTGGEQLPADVPEREAVVERSVPLEKGLADALLVWEMNGQPLPNVHGGPLRLLVPGYWGINNVKFLKKLALTKQESDAAIMVSSYRITPIGGESGPSLPTMWAMNVKSFVSSPSGEEGEELKGGPVRVLGVAWAGEEAIAKVEVTTDGGESWNDATLFGPDLGPAAWRQFTHVFDAKPGEHVIASRATDVKGNVQPEEEQPNDHGYGHNGWRDPAVTVQVA